MYRPEIGEECFVNWHSGELHIHAVITYISDEVGCYKTKNKFSEEEKEYTFTMESVYFSPIKSKQDTEIEEIESILNSGGFWSEPALRLYNAGYRKQLPYSQLVSIIQCYLKDNNCFYLNVECLGHARQLAAKLNRTPDEG